MIYILEGSDGVGKTTLAREIQDKTKGHILHCTWKKDWVMKTYFIDILRAARKLNETQDVVLDRWAPSEFVYGNVFRGGPQFDIFDFLWMHQPELENVKWIYCKNKNAVANHLKNSKKREEMFSDMTDIVANFHLFVNDTPELNWITYDYDEVDKEEFVKELLK